MMREFLFIINQKAFSWAACLILVIFFLESEAGAFDLAWGHGPLPARNYTPVALLFLNMVPEPAKTLRTGQWRLTTELVETNTILLSETGRVNSVIKLETLRASLNAHYGVSDRLEIGLEIPFLYRFDGFLNPFIESVEEAFRELSPNRIKLTNNEFEYRMDLDGVRIITGGKNDLSIGDVVLVSKFLAFGELEKRPAVAFRFALKLATGDPDNAFGSGNPDIGLGLAVQKGIGEKWVIYANVNGIFPGGSFLETDIDLDPYYSGVLAGEYRLTPQFSILTQFEYFSSPFNGIHAPILEDGVGEITVGISYLIAEKFLWQIGAIENFTDPFPDESAADFSIFTTFSYQS